MDILMFNYEYPPIGGGGGWISSLIAEELARSHHLTVITSGYDDLPTREDRNGVDILRVRVWGRGDSDVASLRSLLSYPLLAYRAGMRLTSRRHFDVINSHFAVPTGPGSLAVARRRSVPHVLSLHGGDLYDPSKTLSPHRIPPIRRTVSVVLDASDVVVAQSSNTKENVYRYYGYKGIVEVIPLGILPPAVEPAPRGNLGLPENVFLLVTVGRLIKRKGVDGLLRALARPECDGIHLVVVGSGPEFQPLQLLAGQLGLAERVHFVGHVEDRRKWEILFSADGYVSATLHEGFGLVYVEAMMAGLPVISYDYGGQTDFLRDGETGYLVRAGDEVGLAAGIGRLARHTVRASEIGRLNRAASDVFTIERCAGAYEQLFERVAAGRKRSIHEAGAGMAD